MVDNGSKALALSKIKEFDIMFTEYAYEEESDHHLVISGEDVAMEFK